MQSHSDSVLSCSMCINMLAYTCICVYILASVSLHVYPYVEVYIDRIPLPILSLPFPLTVPFSYIPDQHMPSRNTDPKFIISEHVQVILWEVAVVLSICGDGYTHNVTPSTDSSHLNMHSLGQLNIYFKEKGIICTLL